MAGCWFQLPNVSVVSIHTTISALGVRTWQRHARYCPFVMTPYQFKIQKTHKQFYTSLSNWIGTHINIYSNKTIVFLIRLLFNMHCLTFRESLGRAWNLRGHMAGAAAANARVRNGHVLVRSIDMDRSQRPIKYAAAAREKAPYCRSSRAPAWLSTHTCVCMQAGGKINPVERAGNKLIRIQP